VIEAKTFRRMAYAQGRSAEYVPKGNARLWERATRSRVRQSFVGAKNALEAKVQKSSSEKIRAARSRDRGVCAEFAEPPRNWRDGV